MQKLVTIRKQGKEITDSGTRRIQNKNHENEKKPVVFPVLEKGETTRATLRNSLIGKEGQ